MSEYPLKVGVSERVRSVCAKISRRRGHPTVPLSEPQRGLSIHNFFLITKIALY